MAKAAVEAAAVGVEDVVAVDEVAAVMEAVATAEVAAVMEAVAADTAVAEVATAEVVAAVDMVAVSVFRQSPHTSKSHYFYSCNFNFCVETVVSFW